MPDQLTREDIETRPEVIYSEPGDHERFAHYVDQRVWSIADAIINGTPVQAQCGKWWVPARDPQKFPVCPDCQAIVDYRAVD